MEDVMRRQTVKWKFEHPVHSFILDTGVIAWRKVFSKENHIDIQQTNVRQLLDLPDVLRQYVDSFDTEF